MTFEEFRDTRVWSDDIGAQIPDMRWEGEPNPPTGYIYAEQLYIEQVTADWPETARKRGRWYLLLCNEESISDDLEMLERKLFEYALDEQVVR